MYWILLILSLAEFVLFVMLARFFNRLRKSEELIVRLRSGQESLLEKLKLNAELEQELMRSFIARQAALLDINAQLEDRIATLNTLLEQAETVSRSPQFLRELILSGTKKGRNPEQLAKATGLSLDEVQLILLQAS